MTDKSDILILGATGFTGRLITKYLTSHNQNALFTLALGARSHARLQKLVEDLDISAEVGLIEVDVKDTASIERAVKNTRVVINTVSPYWTWGTPVVRACVLNGIHYLDLSGDTPWIKKNIHEYHYAATKTGSIVVHSCGYVSLLSDISAYLSNKTLKAHTPTVGLGKSISAHKSKAGMSGGTWSALMTMFEEVPEAYKETVRQPYSLSPAIGGEQPERRFLYNLAVPSGGSIVGGYWPMRESNVWLVQRTFGLLEAQALTIEACASSTDEEKEVANQARYGPHFVYDEIAESSSRLTAFISSLGLTAGIAALESVRLLRTLVKRMVPQPGSGPSEKELESGFFEITNFTTSSSTPHIHVETTLKGQGDPGYLLTAIMISESALSLLLPLQSVTEDSNAKSAPDIRRLTSFAKQGGVLTPMTAFGDELVTRLSETGKFTFTSRALDNVRE